MWLQNVYGGDLDENDNFKKRKLVMHGYKSLQKCVRVRS